MTHDYTRLVGRIYLVFGSKSKFADKMRMSRPTLDNKLSGKSDWTQSEIRKASELLSIEKEDIPSFFFAD